MTQESKICVKSSQNTEQQEAMAFLRERYLRLLSTLCAAGEGDCEIKMYENTCVRGEIRAFDSNFENIVVDSLRTPMPGPIGKAILRTNDIISMQFSYDCKKLM